MSLDKIFKPKNIAVIGASGDAKSVGFALFKNLLNSKFKGEVTPINYKRRRVQGIRTYKSIAEAPEKYDLAIIATPATTVPQLVEECGKAGVGGIVIVSAGFSEIGKKGEAMSAQILTLAHKYKIRILGPNCLGFIQPIIGLNASFAGPKAKSGRIAFISQSGALCTSILDWSIKNNVGFSAFVSIGEMLDVGIHDLIDYFGRDPNTDSILIYMESLKDARKFMSAARSVSRAKPIVALKSGRSEEGARAARSHTGSLAGNDDVFNAAFARSGVVRVDTVLNLFHTAKMLAMQPRPAGSRLAVITNAGGPGVIATDALDYSGNHLAQLSTKSLKKLSDFLPPAWSHNNPIDILGDAGPDKYAHTLKVCLDDSAVDAILLILTPQAMTDPEAIAREVVQLNKTSKKTIFATWMGGFTVEKGRTILEQGNVPIYRTPEDAISSFNYVSRYAKNINALYETPATIPHAFDPRINESRAIINKVFDEGRETLNEIESKNILKNYEIPVAKSASAMSAADAENISQEIGYPVAMKILSADILHKTDVGGVKLNINSREEAARAYREIVESARKNMPSAKIDGVLIEAMMKKKYELLIGCKRDPIFGPAIVFGMGGVAVEVFKDMRVGLPPLNMSLSRHLIEGTKIYKLLKGYRGENGVDLQAIQFLLYKFAYLIVDFPEIKEIDINPFGVDEFGGVVLDAKIILDKAERDRIRAPYDHLIISPYPKEYITYFKMKGGLDVKIRPIRPEDEPIWMEMYKNFSAKTLKERQISPLNKISINQIKCYTQIDYDREIALIARIKEKSEKKMLGVARLIANQSNTRAEFTIAILDKWQYRGLGIKMTALITDIAQKKGLKTLHARFLLSNKPMIKIFQAQNWKIKFGKKFVYAEKNLTI